MKDRTLKYKLPNKHKIPHIGNLLRQYFKDHKINGSEVARKMGRAPITVSIYKKHESIQSAILYELCHALQHNFFADLSDSLPSHFTKTAQPDLTLQTRIAELENQLQMACAERDVLIKAMKN